MRLEQTTNEWRQYLYKSPELGTEMVKIDEFVANKLEEFGLEVHRGIGGTGIVGVLKNGTSKRSIGLRADMNTLGLQEKNTFDYASRQEGVMYAYDYNEHIAMLLGAAHELTKSKRFNGTIYLIFQPNKTHGNGAKAMIDDGLFIRWHIDEIYAMHNLPGLPQGQFMTRSHALMASESHFEIIIKATGSHAALPHTGTDPIVVGAQIVTALQTIVSRHLDAINETAIISITDFITNGTANMIPSQVTIKGDTRCFNDQTLQKIAKAIERIVAGQCMSADVEYQYRFHSNALSTLNAPEETNSAIKAAAKVVGKENVIIDCERFTISEDFSFMLREVKGCYILIGKGIEETSNTRLQHSQTDFNSEIVPYGIGFWKTLVEQQLSEKDLMHVEKNTLPTETTASDTQKAPLQIATNTAQPETNKPRQKSYANNLGYGNMQIKMI